MSVHSRVAAIALCILAPMAQAHEYWIDAQDYTVTTDQEVTATFRNGEEFQGSSYSYIPRRSVRFDMVVDGEVRPVPARLGDNPAFVVEDLPDGLLTVLQETEDQFVTYTEWAKWLKFAAHKDFSWTEAAHLERGLPQEGFREAYRRYPKALIAVGSGAGQDRAQGLKIEIVAEANPYTDDLSDGLPVQVLLDGAPRADAQVEMFAKDASGAVEITLHRTDDAGRVVLPVLPGHEYLLDSVSIDPIEPEVDGDPVWRTHWAALTFAVPEA
ncbi:MAG: DUF4198 domain-containing protein [Pseudomonadota bacterium]